MFKVLAAIGGLVMLVGVALGLVPVSTLVVSCGSPFREADPVSTGEKFFKELRADCVDRRDSRQDITVVMLIVGGAVLLGGAMGMIAGRDRAAAPEDAAAVGD
ncbi:MAG TPA: hypothetical protein VFG33_23150 [Kribbella sp.]|uniref:hypothetical protein n=1 Tax=Kribbella sp. TaxID=1871183 RepID=UPI002D76E256|nr:hypothetical protein [Kribbella sp.]HET6296300.1 hypothetical protein [Kribbella sp.]